MSEKMHKSRSNKGKGGMGGPMGAGDEGNN